MTWKIAQVNLMQVLHYIKPNVAASPWTAGETVKINQKPLERK